MKKLKTLKTFPLLALLFFACATLLDAAWTRKRISNNDGRSDWPALATSGDYVYVAWIDNTPGNDEIYFRRSIDNGSTWVSKKQLTNTADISSEPRIAVSGAYVYVAWYDKTPGNYEIYFRRSSDNGATWDSIKRLTNTAGNSNRPHIVASGSNVYVAWHDDTPGNWEVYFRRSIDNGSTWKSAKRITNTAADSLNPDIAVDGGNVYLAWWDGETGSRQLYFRKSGNWGAAWDAAQQLTPTAYDCAYAYIALGGSTIYLAFRGDSSVDYDILFSKSEDNGSTWSSLQQVSDTGSYGTLWGMAAKNAKVYLVWHDGSGHHNVYSQKSADGGDTWKSAQRLTYGTGSFEYPHVCLGAVNVFVVYYDNTVGDMEVYVKYKPH